MDKTQCKKHYGFNDETMERISVILDTFEGKIVAITESKPPITIKDLLIESGKPAI